MKNSIGSHQSSRLAVKVKLQLENKIKRLYVNKELIQLIKPNILDKTTKDRLALLHYFKKLVQQVYRSPDPNHKAAFEDEYEAERIAIADEQAFYDPLKWINAEIEYLVYNEPVNESEKLQQQLQITEEVQNTGINGLVTKEHAMKLLETSDSTFNRRISEGLPHYKMGRKIYLCLDEIKQHIKQVHLV